MEALLSDSQRQAAAASSAAAEAAQQAAHVKELQARLAKAHAAAARQRLPPEQVRLHHLPKNEGHAADPSLCTTAPNAGVPATACCQPNGCAAQLTHGWAGHSLRSGINDRPTDQVLLAGARGRGAVGAAGGGA